MKIKSTNSDIHSNTYCVKEVKPKDNISIVFGNYRHESSMESLVVFLIFLGFFFGYIAGDSQ